MNSVYTNQPLPKGLSDRQKSAQFNTQMANAMAAGDPRFTIKQYDRGGISRGGTQLNQAGIDAAKNLSEGVSQAYATSLGNAQYDSGVQLQGEQARESNAQALGALQQQNAYANQLAALQRQQMGMNFMTSLLGGLLS